MEKINIRRVFRLFVLVVAAVLCGETVKSAYSQNPGAVLMLQQSPADGGTVSPGVGVHEYGLGDSVRLMAVPRAGFQFVSWLGDVDNASKNSTTVNLDTPKIIIAVFERIGYDYAAAPEEFGGGAETGGAMWQRGESPSPANGANGEPPREPPKPPRPYRPPVPDTSADFDMNEEPIVDSTPNFDMNEEPLTEQPIPEPASIVMLSLGAGLAWLRRRGGRGS